MSETKANYTPGWGGIIMADVDATIEPIRTSGLPTMLAQSVIEYATTLRNDPATHNDYTGSPATLVEQFSTILLAAAQPLLTEYLHQLTTPPQFVMRTKGEDEDVSERRKTSMYGAYLLKCKERDLVPFSYDEWCNIGDGPKTKGAK